MSALEYHVKFFDLNDDGKIMPWETFIGFRKLGYNIPLSLFGASMTHLTMSYQSQDSWIPDPLFSIVIKNIKNCKHGSDTGIYEHDGEMNKERLDKIYNKFAKNGKLGWSELLEMTNYNMCVFDIFGIFANKFEWGFLYLLQMDKGYVDKEDMRKCIDGSLFYEKDTTKEPLNLI